MVMSQSMPMQDTGESAVVVREVGGAAPRRRWRVVLFLVVVLGVLLARPASHHARATTLLLSFSDAHAKTDNIREERSTFTTPAGRTIPARWYFPANRADAPAVVMVHGVHNKGIEEPRLERFARSVANVGIVVMTPEVEELSDFHVAPRSIDTVGAAIETVRTKTGAKTVGLMGMSFGGGVALLTAADARFADKVSFVVAIGAHDDLARVSRFFATNRIETADGTTKDMHAHDYGAMVLVYTHIEDFFPTHDVPAAREALHAWLCDDRAVARKAAESLSPESHAKIEKLFAADVASIKDDLLREIDRREKDMSAVSPHGHLAGLRASVYLLHGAGDSVIPATETEWLAKDVPPGTLKMELVSPAIVHVELDKPSFVDQWQLVHFMSGIIAEAES
jgi:dienelactone hydrolase